MIDALERLQGGYYNSDPVSEANPGGFADGGHVVNFPAALADLAEVAGSIEVDVEAINGAAGAAHAAGLAALAAEAAAGQAASIAAGRTLRSGEGAPSPELGRDGDYYLDHGAYEIYGPKAAGAWGVGVSLLAPGTELGVSATHIRWRLTGGAWVNLIAIADLKGADAQEISLQKTATHLQWRRGVDAWSNLITLADLEGADGQEVSFQTSATHIQWRLGAGVWSNLVALSALKGVDGQEISLQKSATHIQWRLGGGAWSNLVALTDLSPAKATGADLRAMTDDAAFLTAKSVADAAALVALTDGATIAVDLATGVNFVVTLGGNRTLGAPSNAKPGMTGSILIKQPASGGPRTLAYASAWMPIGSTPSVSTAANAVDVLTYLVETSSKISFSLAKGRAA